MTEQPDKAEESAPDISNRDLLMDLVAVTQRLGHLPAPPEIDENAEYSADQYRDEFGSLFEAYKEAGVIPDSASRSDYESLTTSQEKEEDKDEEKDEVGDVEETSEQFTESPSKSELLDELRRIDESVDGLPYPSDMNEKGEFTVHTYEQRFGSWDEAIEAAGINKRGELLQELERVTKELGKDPTSPEMNEHGKYSVGIYARFFGSWSGAKEELETWREEEDSVAEDLEEEGPQESELLGELEKLDEQIDRLPYPTDVNEGGEFSANVYQERFGSWYNALEAADIINEDALLDEMEKVTEEVESLPSRSEMNEHGDYSASMVSQYFGSWEEAIDRLDEQVDIEEDDDSDDNRDPEKDFDDMVNERLDDILGSDD